MVAPDYVLALQRAIADCDLGDEATCEVDRADLLSAATSLARPTTLSSSLIRLASRARPGPVKVRTRQVAELLDQIERDADDSTR